LPLSHLLYAFWDIIDNDDNPKDRGVKEDLEADQAIKNFNIDF